MIKNKVKIEETFSFDDTDQDGMYLAVKSLNPKKVSDIPVKMLIGTNDIISKYLSTMYNEDKNKNKFPKSLKVANVIPLHKDKERTWKKNYRPVSILPVLSKLYERKMNEQMSEYKKILTDLSKAFYCFSQIRSIIRGFEKFL